MTAGKSSLELKEAGNAAYKQGDFDDALEHYTQGLSICEDDKEKAIILKNRAAVNLKIENYEDVVKDCDKALTLVPSDPKSLFRRGVAHDHLSQAEKAYADIRAVIELDPKNREAQTMLVRLHRTVQDKIAENTQLSGKVRQMFQVVFEPSSENTTEKRATATNNLVALAKDKSGAEALMAAGVIPKLVSLLKMEKNVEVRVAAMRCLGQFSKLEDWCLTLLTECGLPWFVDVINSPSEEMVTATEYCLVSIVKCMARLNDKEPKKKGPPEPREHQRILDTIMLTVTASLTNRAMTAVCRDALLKILIKFLPYDMLDWVDYFTRAKGIEKLLDIASEVDEIKDECSISCTQNTRLTTAVLLSKIYDSLGEDKDRLRISDIVDDHIKETLMRDSRAAQIRVCVMVNTLLLGPLDLGSQVVSKEGILSMLLAMADAEDDVLQQKVASETLIAAASKKDKCRSILSQGTDILKRLYNSKDPSIKVRALVGLCKLGSLGGSDASMRPFSDGASSKLAEACRRFLVTTSQDKDMRRWACEGLSYLTLDAEIKERLIEDTPALRSMIELAKSGDLNCVYGVVTCFVNLVNAYDKQEVMPEMLELAKFAKQHIPEEHELDDKDFVDKRIEVLASEGAGAALVMLSKTDSDNCKELIARIFMAMCELPPHRGLMVQQGASKALLSLSMEGTPKGKNLAAQALARIAISIDPEQSFPGQRVYEVVRPLLSLLSADCAALANFEALLGLCNIAGGGESARQRILKEKGLPSIEHYMYEHHEMIRRAAVQCFANMCMSPDVVKSLEGKNDKMKYLVLCGADEDLEICKAASGALCMVLGESDKLPPKMFEAQAWLETMLFLVTHSAPDVAYRGAVILSLMVKSDKDTARTVINTHLKEALVALCKLDPQAPGLVHPKAQEHARETLQQCVQWELIRDPFSEGD